MGAAAPAFATIGRGARAQSAVVPPRQLDEPHPVGLKTVGQRGHRGLARGMHFSCLELLTTATVRVD